MQMPMEGERLLTENKYVHKGVPKTSWIPQLYFTHTCACSCQIQVQNNSRTRTATKSYLPKNVFAFGMRTVRYAATSKTHTHTHMSIYINTQYA